MESLYALHGGCLIRGRNSLPFPSTLVRPRFVLGFVACCSFFLAFCVVLCFSFVCRPRHVFYVCNVANVSGLSILDYHLGLFSLKLCSRKYLIVCKYLALLSVICALVLPPQPTGVSFRTIQLGTKQINIPKWSSETDNTIAKWKMINKNKSNDLQITTQKTKAWATRTIPWR